MELQTERLRLRPWAIEDAPAAYELARDPEIGPLCGWPPHESVEQSQMIIQNVLNKPWDYCVVRKSDGQLIGCISLLDAPRWKIEDGSRQMEIGFWIGRPYWGEGYVTEAAAALITYGFQTLGLDRIWCGALKNNVQSRRAQEKLGFQYFLTVPSRNSLIQQENPEDVVSVLDRGLWQQLS